MVLDRAVVVGLVEVELVPQSGVPDAHWPLRVIVDCPATTRQVKRMTKKRRRKSLRKMFVKPVEDVVNQMELLSGSPVIGATAGTIKFVSASCLKEK